MSYVRYNTDSDVYAWGDVDGTFKLSIAQHRPRAGADPGAMPPGPDPAELPSPTEDYEQYKVASQQWYQDHQAEMAEYQSAHYDTIDHKDAGKLLSFGCLEEMHERATQLLNEGLLIPQRFFDAVNADIQLGNNTMAAPE